MYLVLTYTVWLQIVVVQNFWMKPFILNFWDKFFLWISINFVKIQIYTSYDVGNIRPQNGFVFHMHAQVAIEGLVKLANYI